MGNLEICEKIIIEQYLPNLVGKETLNPQLREISSLPLKMGGLNIKLPSDHESLCQSVIFGSLTLRIAGALNFGVKFNFSKIRMEPVMHDFLAITENRKRERRTIEYRSRESCQIKTSGKLLFAISIIVNKSRAVPSEIEDRVFPREQLFELD